MFVVYRGQEEKVSGETGLGCRFLSGHQRDGPQSSDGEHQSSFGPRRALFTEETTQQSHRYVCVLESRWRSRLRALMTRAVCFRYFLYPERGRRASGEHQEERSACCKQPHHYYGGAVGDRRCRKGEGVRSGSGGGTHLWDVRLCGGHTWSWWETVLCQFLSVQLLMCICCYCLYFALKKIRFCSLQLLSNTTSNIHNSCIVKVLQKQRFNYRGQNVVLNVPSIC